MIRLKGMDTLIRHPEVRAKRASKDGRPGPSPFEGLALLGHLSVTENGRVHSIQPSWISI
jgi:hypothetical protein